MAKKKGANGAVKISNQQAEMLNSLLLQKQEVEKQLGLVLGTIAAGEGVTNYTGVNVDTDKKEVRFEVMDG